MVLAGRASAGDWPTAVTRGWLAGAAKPAGARRGLRGGGMAAATGTAVCLGGPGSRRGRGSAVSGPDAGAVDAVCGAACGACPAAACRTADRPPLRRQVDGGDRAADDDRRHDDQGRDPGAEADLLKPGVHGRANRGGRWRLDR